MTLTVKELEIVERLVTENRDSARLQKVTGLDYTDSIMLLNKIRKMRQEKV